MKKLLLFLPFLLLFSCSIQKRKYQSGYYVDWNSKKAKKEKPVASQPKTSLAGKKSKVTPEPAILVTHGDDKKELSASSELTLKDLELKKSFSLYSPPEDSCDVLVFKDGSEIKAKVQEVGTNEIKYKRCDTPEGPTYISRKSELFMIKYANGTKEVVKSEAPPQVQPQIRTPSHQNTRNYRDPAFKRQNHPLAIASLFLGIAALVIAYIALVALSSSLFLPAAVYILPFFIALAAMITGKIALKRIKEQPDIYKGKGMAIPGFIMGCVLVGIYLLIFLVAALIFI